MVNVCALHAHTPTLSVTDPRGLPVRSVSFHRTRADESVTERVDRSGYDSAGRLTRRWDPRLWDRVGQDSGTPSNLSFILSLTAQPLLSERVDAGWDVEFCGSAGERRCRWDAKANVQLFEYDSSMRPSAVFEVNDAVGLCTERLAYGGANDAFANQCGQLIRHDDRAGSVSHSAFSLTGEVTEQVRRFLDDLEVPDWPVLVSERDALLGPGEGARSGWRFGPLSDALEQTDAVGNVQAFAYTVAGQLKSTGLQLRGQSPQTLVSDIAYDAQGRITSETAGNGVVTALDYDPVDGRLIRLRADNGRLQDLNYAYDPVGNVLQIEDLAQPVRHFANQQVEPLRTFAYDTLYQLIEATGYEAKTMNRGPANDAFRTFMQADELGSYTQRYEYDAAGNLQTLIHTGAQHFTRRFATASTSNRSVLQTADQPPSEEQIAASFDLCGNLRALQAGQDLAWNSRNQLSEVTPVVRESGINDSEVYRYDAAGLRVRKVRTTQARTVTHHNEVRYLPGLELRTNTATGEVLHVITATAGRSAVRVLHWQTGKPETFENDQVRYSLSDHLGSSTLELSADGQLISQEIYYPYGETAWFAGRGDVEVSYKTLRYSGKERDATGLYYYGLRYYAPWLMRWINPDPAGERGGINLYEMVSGNPLKYVDRLGEAPQVPMDIHYIWIGKSDGLPRYLSNIRDAALLNFEFTVNVHMDLKDGDRGGEDIEKALSKFKNIKITHLRNEPFFAEFQSSPSYAVYADLFGDDARNYASATDVLRYSLINHYGGLYVDVDDQFKRGVRPDDFTPKKNRVFTVEPVNPPWDAKEYVINNNAFASHSQNPTLQALSKQVTDRYAAHKASASGLTLSAMPVGSEKMKIVSQVTGPKMFTSVLTEKDQKLKKIFDAVVALDQSDKRLKKSDRHYAQIEKRMPISRFIKMGEAHTWK